MALADVTDPAAVLEAIDEEETLGRDQFLHKYGFGPSREYFLEYGGRRYDSKAIVGAAHGFQHPTRGPLSAQDFSGGEQTVKRRLEGLGFTVVVATPEAPVATQTALATNPDGGGRAGPAVCNWIFQANPELYDLVNEVRQGTDDRRFAVNAHWRRINAGDRIWFRVTGQRSGLYLAGTAASRPYEHPGPFGKRYVDVSYDSWIEPPLLTVAIQHIHDLATYRPLTGSQGTNFIIPSKIADKIEQLIRQRLVPVNRPSRPDRPACEVVPVEGQHVEQYSFNGSSAQVSAERREQRLVLAYCHWMRQRGSTLGRLRIVPGGPGAPLYSDIYDESRKNLIEAKGIASRMAVRMAIGELADYHRAAPSGSSRAVLLPDRPEPDLEDLLTLQGVASVWQEDDKFRDNADGRFV